VRRVVADDVDGPLWDVKARNNAVEVDQRHLLFHRESEADIVAVSRVIPSISVTQQAVFAEGIVVRPVFTLD
jgi:hypothetical protein